MVSEFQVKLGKKRTSFNDNSTDNLTKPILVTLDMEPSAVLTTKFKVEGAKSSRREIFTRHVIGKRLPD